MIIPVIVGPTAVGKTALSIKLAKKLNGEIISVDSMQIYKGLDVATAKIKEVEMQNIKHHLLDIKEINERFTVVEFKELALKIIKDIKKRGKTPILVGGTGLYVNSLVYNYNFDNELELVINQNPELKNKLDKNKYNEAILKFKKEIVEKFEKGEITLEKLYEIAYSLDPDFASKISKVDKKKILKIIETQYIFDMNKSELETLKKIKEAEILKNDYQINENLVITSNENKYLIFELSIKRDLLYQRINQRVDLMIQEGLIEETKQMVEKLKKLENKELKEILKNSKITALQAIGYKQVIQYLIGEITYEQMVEILKRDSRRYAKRQLTWFRKLDTIKLDKSKIEEELIDEIISKL